jgi:hypothetical protein
MRSLTLAVLTLTTAAIAQNALKPAPQSEPKSVTVPITLSHNRVIVDVSVPLPNGTTQRVRAWVDNGNPDLYLSQRLAVLTGVSVSCDDQVCSAAPPEQISIGGMTIPVGGRIPGRGIKEAKVPTGGAPIAPGLDAEINLPSTLLRNYDVLINFPDHEFTIAQPGTLKFKGVTAKTIVNGANGVIQIPSQIGNKKYNLVLDVGESISFLAKDLFDRLSAAHPDWPHLTGAIGPANLRGLPEELKWKLMRVDRLQFGPLFFTDVAVVDFPEDRERSFEKRASIPTAGLLGANTLLNYRIGLDYAHSTVYFDIGRLFNFPDFDVIGLIVRPEDDGRFTIVGIADFEGKPSVDQVQAGDHLVAVDGIPAAGSGMGQVWSMLGGEPGKERKLTIERSGKQFTIEAKVRHFLAETDEDDKTKEKSHKK